MTLALRYAVRSDVGLLREGNEDSAYAGPHLLAIADGMGGHAAGEVASSVAIAAIADLDNEVPVDQLLDSLAAAVAEANNTLHEMSIEDPSVEGMGTTLTALLWSGSTVAICHIGDSRAYLLRDGEFQQITIGRANDATLVLSDDYASSRHARLFPQNGQWIVEDLGSTNGTYLDRQKVTQPTPVPAGVPIRIGKTVLELRR
jgi:protein phosphatase